MSLARIATRVEQIELTEMQTIAPGHSRRVKTGTRSGLVSLEVDADVLLRVLGAKALKNKSGRAKLANGAVVVRVINKQDREI